MNPRAIILYRDTPRLSVARFRLHQARKADKTFVAIRFTDPDSRPVKGLTLTQRFCRWLLS